MSLLNINTTPMLKYYFSQQINYQEKYGDKTVVLMQVGSFYECYTIEDKKVGKAKELSNLLNIQISKKSKSNKNEDCLMIGFPIYIIQKYVDKLIEYKYTVAVIIQYIDPDTKEIKRKLNKIYSPGTYIDNEISTSNYIISIYIENTSSIKSANLSSIDLTTGKSIVFQTFNHLYETNKTDNDIFRFIHSLNPTEILFCSNTKNLDLINKYNLNDKIVHFQEIDKTHLKLSYQSHLLKKIYGSHKILSPIEYIGLEKYPELVISFVELLNFVYEHDPDITKKIHIPKFQSDDNLLILNNDSLYQLNLVNNNSIDNHLSLLNIIDHTKTNLGKRLIRERLLNPITDENILNERYNKIKNMRKDYKIYENILKYINDLEKKNRRGLLSKLTPHELSQLITSYEYVLQLLDKCKKYFPKLDISRIKNNLDILINDIKNTFIINQLVNFYSVNAINNSIFKKGIHEEIDNIQQDIEKYKGDLDLIAEKLSEKIDNIPNSVKLMYTEKDGYYFSTTTHRSIKLKNLGLDFENNKNYVKIRSKEIISLSRKLVSCEKKINEIIIEKYIETIRVLFTKNNGLLKKCCEIVAELDVIYSSAISSIKNAYHEPTISLKDKSYFKGVDIRHPIIEKIIDKEYISNDLYLGLKEDNFGLLLYGTNSSGKCFGKGIKVRLYNNKDLINVEDIKVGDLLLGDDYGYRYVKAVNKGYGTMYKIKLYDHSYDYSYFTCNKHHILCLKKNDKYLNISLKKYMKDIYTKYNDYVMYSSNHLLKKCTSFRGDKEEIIELDFIIEKTGKGEYFGFEVEGNNHKILLKDNVVSHNSSILRSIGCTIVLAQAGFYVPCKNFTYHPYKSLFSKISNVDNLYKGQSTFIVEMDELKNIIQRGCKDSLILADELCSGTESLSATSIVSSTIFELIEKQSTFIFSTHLHQLMEINIIKNLELLKVKHFRVYMDNGELVFDRKLKDGEGDKLYGLEIAKSLNISSSFIKKAFEIRALLVRDTTEILPTKTSKYNKDLYMDECKICGIKKPEKGYLETHHINEQCKADKNGIINDKFHKNELHNLVVLCRECHENVHKGKINLDEYLF